jgi:hypothetical protein
MDGLSSPWFRLHTPTRRFQPPLVEPLDMTSMMLDMMKRRMLRRYTDSYIIMTVSLPLLHLIIITITITTITITTNTTTQLTQNQNGKGKASRL